MISPMTRHPATRRAPHLWPGHPPYRTRSRRARRNAGNFASGGASGNLGEMGTGKNDGIRRFTIPYNPAVSSERKWDWGIFLTNSFGGFFVPSQTVAMDP